MFLIFQTVQIPAKFAFVEKAWEMVFGALLSAQHGVQIESSWDRAYEGYLALSASTHHYRMLKKWASVDRKGVYGLMGHVQRNRDVENLLGDAEYAQAADVVSSSAADQLRKRKFQDDRGKAHVMLVKHLVQADLKPQEMDARLLKVPKAKLQKQMHSVSQGLDHFQDSPTSMAGTRAIHQACNVPHNGQYTPEELDGACISFILGLATQKELQQSHGPSARTICGTVAKIYKAIATPGESHNDARTRTRKMTAQGIRAVLQGMRMRGELKQPGVTPYLSPSETLVVMGCAGASASIGVGVSGVCMRSQIATALNTSGVRAQRTIAQAQREGQEVSASAIANAHRMTNAKVGKGCWSRLRRVYNAAGGLGGNTLLKKGPVKGVAVSLARATTNSTGLTAQLFQNIEEAYADARIKGDLKDGCMPEPWQLLNADEVGFDPEGKFSKIEAFAAYKKTQVLRCSEHALFWTSAVIFSCADGSLSIPPFVVHQGCEDSVCLMSTAIGEDVDAAGNLANQLPSTWGVAQSPSGYVVAGIWRRACAHLINSLPARRPYFLYMDGYAAHFDEFALNLLRNAHVYIIFLRSQNSENDQPNDNGLNAILKRCYDVCYATWKGETSAHAVMTFRPCFFNLILLRAWEKVSDGSNKQAVIRAWAKCGLSPLNEEMALTKECALSSGAFFNTGMNSQKDSFNSMLFPKVVNGEVLMPGLRLSLNDAGQSVSEPQSLSMQSAMCPPSAIRAFVTEVIFQRAQDATTTHAVINAMKKAKSTKVSVSQDEHGVRFGRNGQPSTTGGLYVNEAVMSAIKAKNLFEVQQEFEQGQRAELRASKSVTKWAEETAIAAAVKVAMAGNVVGTAFKIPGFKAPEIVIAANVLTSATPKVTTKAAALSALETFWLQQTTYSAA